MARNEVQRTGRDPIRQEALLIGLVCAVALVATLSVFVPAIRHLWIRLALLLGM